MQEREKLLEEIYTFLQQIVGKMQASVCGLQTEGYEGKHPALEIQDDIQSEECDGYLEELNDPRTGTVSEQTKKAQEMLERVQSFLKAWGWLYDEDDVKIKEYMTLLK